MNWIELAFSKKQVRRAGDYLIEKQDVSDVDKLFESFDVLSNWRSSHAYPMHSMLMYFRNKAFLVDAKALVVQRLKRTPSILAKLRRESGMKLDRMEDVAGCRIVVSTKADVYLTRDLIVGGRTRNILHRERDYIANPKDSGYRGIHLVYKYSGAKKQYNNHKIELQIRSKIQHSWATAVEVVDAFTGQALKASQGHDAWLNFFKYTSVAFSDMENRKLAKDASSTERHELIKYISRLDVLSRLRAFAVSTRHLGKDTSNKNDFFLLTLEIDKSNIKVRRFPSDQLGYASREYAEQEAKFKDNDQKDVVLVAASSIHSLKKAYPNYFADTTEFAKYLEKIIEADKKIHPTSSVGG